MEGIIIIIIALGGFAALIIWSIKYSKKVNARKGKFYGDFALKHSLDHSTTKYMLASLNTVQGTWEGMPFILYEKMEGSGKNRTVVTRAVFENVPFDFDFKIGKEHLFSKAGKVLGMKDIEFGDVEFDKKFLIKSKEEDKFRAFFNYKLQEELKQIKGDLAASIRVDNGKMTYMHYGPLAKETQFASFEKVVGFMFTMLKEANYKRS